MGSSALVAVGKTINRKKDEELDKAWNETQFAGWPRAERERSPREFAKRPVSLDCRDTDMV